jgi:hypothetical protein
MKSPILFQAGAIALLPVIFMPTLRAVDPAPKAQMSFAELSDEFLRGYFAARPSSAVTLGVFT